MHFPSKVAALAFASSAIASFIGPIDIPPYKNVILEITDRNTVNSTNPINIAGATHSRRYTTQDIPLNNKVAETGIDKRQSGNVVYQFRQFAFGKGTKVTAYIYGNEVSQDSNNGAMVFVDKTGKFYYPKANACAAGQACTPTTIPADSIAIPVPDDTSAFNVTLPGQMSGGRVAFAVNGTLAFFANGSPNGKVAVVAPSATNVNDMSYGVFWGFTEFTYNGGGNLFINPSAVDFAGCPNTFTVEFDTNHAPYGSGGYGLLPNGAVKLSNLLNQQNQRDGQPWNQLTRYNSKNQLVRVLSANSYIGGNFGNNNHAAFQGYWEPYVNQVWQQYTNNKLTLNTTMGNSVCQVSNNQLSCSGDSTPYNKPSTDDIFSCNTGPFGNVTAGNQQHQLNVPILCAGFVRSIMLLSATQPSGPVSSYYTHNPTDWYSSYLHNNVSYGASGPNPGYTFPYDDTNAPGTVDQSGTVKATNAKSVTHFIGGYTNPGQYNPGQYS